MSLKNSTRLCSVCFNIADSEFCPICRNEKRDKSSICVVEQPQDILALEHSGIYKGLYHVLHGAISPTDGIGISDIRIEELMVRLKDGDISEVILATNPDLSANRPLCTLIRLSSRWALKLHGLPEVCRLERSLNMPTTLL